MPFAKSGVPFEFGLKAVNFTLATMAMGIFIFKAPFNRLIRCTVPFKYFFFYQYGVISRPYSLMMLGFVLSALTYKDRNERPYRFVAALSLVCGASAYGMVIAAGISMVWLLEIFDNSISLEKIQVFLNSKKSYALIILSNLQYFTYLLHQVDSKGYKTKKMIRSLKPNVLIGTGDSNYTFGSEINLNDYTLVKPVSGNTIWKDRKGI